MCIQYVHSTSYLRKSTINVNIDVYITAQKRGISNQRYLYWKKVQIVWILFNKSYSDRSGDTTGTNWIHFQLPWLAQLRNLKDWVNCNMPEENSEISMSFQSKNCGGVQLVVNRNSGVAPVEFIFENQHTEWHIDWCTGFWSINTTRIESTRTGRFWTPLFVYIGSMGLVCLPTWMVDFCGKMEVNTPVSWIRHGVPLTLG